MSRISKTNRFDLELWRSLEDISNKTKIPMSRLLDEGLEYLVSRYLKPAPKPEETPAAVIIDELTGMPNDLITMSEASRKYKTSTSNISRWAIRGFIKSYKTKTSKTYISEKELKAFLVSFKARMYKQVEVEGDLIPMSQACRHYKLRDSVLSDWANRGLIKRYPRPDSMPYEVKGRVFISKKELEECLTVNVRRPGKCNT